MSCEKRYIEFYFLTTDVGAGMLTRANGDTGARGGRVIRVGMHKRANRKKRTLTRVQGSETERR